MTNNENEVETEEEKALKEKIASWSKPEDIDKLNKSYVSGLDKLSEDIEKLDSTDDLKESEEEKKEIKSKGF